MCPRPCTRPRLDADAGPAPEPLSRAQTPLQSLGEHSAGVGGAEKTRVLSPTVHASINSTSAPHVRCVHPPGGKMTTLRFQGLTTPVCPRIPLRVGRTPSVGVSWRDKSLVRGHAVLGAEGNQSNPQEVAAASDCFFPGQPWHPCAHTPLSTWREPHGEVPVTWAGTPHVAQDSCGVVPALSEKEMSNSEEPHPLTPAVCQARAQACSCVLNSVGPFPSRPPFVAGDKSFPHSCCRPHYP